MQDVSVANLLASNIEPVFWVPKRLGKHSAWWGHVPFAFWLTANCSPRLIVELGTYNGVSYAAFCEAVARRNMTTQCYAVDTWAGDEHAGLYRSEVFDDLKQFNDAHFAGFSTLVQKTFDEARESFEDRTIDVLHIDGLHTYEAVSHDFNSWRPKLSERAVVLFHDTNVRNRDFGVWQFFGELKNQFPSFEFLHCNGLGIIAPGSEPPPSVKALCELQGGDVAVMQERFSEIGACWMAVAEIEGFKQSRTWKAAMNLQKAAAVVKKLKAIFGRQ